MKHSDCRHGTGRRPPAVRFWTPRARVLLAACAGGIAFACASGPGIDVDFDLDVDALPDARPAPSDEFPLPPERLESLLREPGLELLSLEPLAAGVTGAFRARFRSPKTGEEFDAKWKPSPPEDADGWNNSPRKEIAAYVIQKWFLAPRDYVVPTTAGLCIPLAHYRRFDPKAEANLPEASCVLGAASVWLRDVEVPDEIFDEERFRTEPTYAYHFAHFNLLSHLIDHRDARSGNILVSTDDAHRRVFSVDNGISFNPAVYNFFVLNWHELRVPALPAGAVERLRSVPDERYAQLATTGRFERSAEGVFRPARTEGDAPEACGACLEGPVLILGLTESEIAALRERVAALLAAVDDGRLAVF